jgi:signal transduction histidine kinase
VSERQRQAEALREARIDREIALKAKAGFLANMSHELRTPLNAIIGFTDVMAAEMFGPLGHANYREYVADIQLSSRHLLEIITDILQMAKIEAGGVVLHEENVDLRATARFCRRLVRGRAAPNVGIALEFPADLPALWADERLVKQILLNLLSNAVKFTLANGHITVRAACDEAGRLVLEVRDTGIGIAPEDVEKALTPFGQIDNAYTRRHGGTGLGLPIVKSYADLHGAAFAIESAPGQGTCVRISFPAARVRAVSPKENGGP